MASLCRFFCCTHCAQDAKPHCPWTGAATINTEPIIPEDPSSGFQVSIKYQAHEHHAPLERVLYDTLTWRQRQCVFSFPPYKDKASIPSGCQLSLASISPIGRPCLQNLANSPVSCADIGPPWDHASSPEEPVQARGSFDVSDFKFLEERLNGDLEGGTTFSHR